MKLFNRINLGRSNKESAISAEVSGLLRFVQEQKHFAIMYVLLNGDSEAQKLLQETSKVVEEPFLHYLLKKSNPPANLVELVLLKQGGGEELLPTADELLDKKGRTALHVAAAYGCNTPVIKLLLAEEGRVQATMKDDRNRTPLHWACRSLSSSRKHDPDRLEMIAAILEAYPHAIRLLDNDGKSPIDLAKANKANSKTIKLLEAAEKGEPKWLDVSGNSDHTEVSFSSGLSVGEDLDDDASDLSSIGFNEDHIDGNY